MGLNHTSTEARYWRSLLEPIMAPHKNIRWDVTADTNTQTVYCKIVHINHSVAVGKNPELVAKINVDRALRAEKDIFAEIKKAIDERKDI